MAASRVGIKYEALLWGGSDNVLAMSRGGDLEDGLGSVIVR